MDRNEKGTRDANRDPLTGEPGAHPVGVGIGTAAGGAVLLAHLSNINAAAFTSADIIVF